MACIWNIEVSLRFVCVRRRLGSKDTESKAPKPLDGLQKNHGSAESDFS